MKISKCLKELMKYNRWDSISAMEVLTESFIEKYKDQVKWRYICTNQVLSESFIEKHKDMVDWYYIFKYQVLSEAFIEKHKDQYDHSLGIVSETQQLSEAFIEKYKGEVDWWAISVCQVLSPKFSKTHLNKIQQIQQATSNAKKSLAKKRSEMKKYAKLWNLKFDGEFLYAFRNHDIFGRGSYNHTKIYEKGKTYRDWHCDMDERNFNSFGFGIWPAGNTPVKVAVKDWGCAVTQDDHEIIKFRKGRVFAFTVLP